MLYDQNRITLAIGKKNAEKCLLFESYTVSSK